MFYVFADIKEELKGFPNVSYVKDLFHNKKKEGGPWEPLPTDCFW